MKKILVGAVAAAAILTPCVANADVGVQLRGTYATLDEDGDDDKEDAWGLSGAVVNEMGNNWVVQFNGSLADMDHNDHTDSFELFEGHVGYDFGGFVLGGFVTRFDWAGSPYNLLGIEGHTQIGRFSIDGSYSTGEQNDNAFAYDLSNLSFVGAFALTDAFSIHASYSDTDWDFDDSEAWGLGVNYAIPNTAFSVGGGWRTFESDGGTDTEAFGINFGWNFGDNVRSSIGAGAVVSDAIMYQ